MVSPAPASDADDMVLAVNDNGAVAVITADSVSGNGTDNSMPDVFRLVRNGPDVVLNIDGKYSRSFAFDSLCTIIVDGSGDDDTLTIDLSQGTPVPYGGLTYNGQGNGSGGDSLEIVGGTLSSVCYEYTGLSDGVITIDGSIVRYTGLEPIIDTVVAGTLTVNGTAGNNNINYTQGSCPPFPLVCGKVAVDSFETIEFANKTNLVINALGGNNVILLNNSSLPTGLSTIAVNGGGGIDFFILMNAGNGLPGPVSLNGGDSNDFFHVSPSTSAVVNVDGGNDRDVLFVNAQGAPAWDTGSAVLFSSSSGFKAFNYTNVAVVVIDNYTPTSIGDYVWEDTNADGIQDISELGIDGVIVNLYQSDDTPAGTTVTAGGGLYSFTDLIPGDYYVEFIIPPGYVFSPQDQGSDNTLDSDADTTTGKTTVTTLDPGENDTTWDGGMYQPASIGDYVWEDTNADGIQNIGEPGIDEVIVSLYQSDDTPAGTTTTAGGGLYSFTGLIPGDYYVEFIIPPGYVFSPQDQGSDNTLDSDADITTGKSTVTTLDSGENDNTWDAGMYQPHEQPYAVGGEVYPVNRLMALAPLVILVVAMIAVGIFLVRRRAFSSK